MEVGLLDFRIRPVGLGSEEAVLGEGDAGQHLAGLVDLFVEIEFLHAGLYCTLGIGAVVHCKTAGIAYAGGIIAEETDEYGVEGSHDHPACSLAADQQRDPLLHLFRSLLGKSQRQHPRRVHFQRQDVGHPARKHLGFTGACAGHYEYRPVHTFHRFTLPGIEPGDNRFYSFLLFHIRGTKLRKF